jgi:phage/plasmid-like protein (TIGR03299 family)
MGHQLMVTKDGHAMAWSGDTPWHGLGTESEGLMTSQEALELARLDWQVRKEQVFIYDGNEDLVPVPNTFATVRNDMDDASKTVILTKSGKTVGPLYTPFQNSSSMAFIDDLINEQAAVIEVAGALGEGQRVWVLAKLPTHVKVMDNDFVDNYILISNTHDGSGAIRIQPTPIRVVCNNTLTAALRKKDGSFTIRHTKNAADKVDAAREVLKLVNLKFDDWAKEAQTLTRIKMTRKEMEEYLEDSLGLVRDDEGELSTRADNILKEAIACLDHETNNLEGMVGTAWQAYNALTYYVDHISTLTDKGNVSQAKTESSLFGSASNKKVKAWEKALEMTI